MNNYKRAIVLLSKKHGLSLKANAATYLVDYLEKKQQRLEDLEDTIDYIAQSYIQHQGLRCF
jgi:hypothetical protein